MTACTGAGGTGIQYTYAQLMGLWINAGGPSAVAPVAAAVAEAESGGCTAALNLTDNNGTQTSVGLWQVSNGTHSYPASWTTAAGNAAEAVAKYKGAGNAFSPWGTYDSGAYKAFLNGSTTADTNVPSGGSASSGSAATLTSATSDPTCAWSWPSAGIGIPGTGIGTSVGGGCAIHKTAIRHALGGVLMVAGASIALPGVLVLVAFSFQNTPAAAAATQAAGALGPYGKAVSRVSRPARRTTPAPAAAPARARGQS
jgi:hypothetical protein